MSFVVSSSLPYLLCLLPHLFTLTTPAAVTATSVSVSCASYQTSSTTTATGTCSDKTGQMVSCHAHSDKAHLAGTNYYNNGESCEVSFSDGRNQRIEASYRCCDLTESNTYSLSCVDRVSSGTSWSIFSTTATCESDETLLGCTAYTTNNANIRAVCVGDDCMNYLTTSSSNSPNRDDLYPSDNKCKARKTSDGSGTIYAVARCCKYDNIKQGQWDVANINFECKTTYGTRTNSNDNSNSWANCDAYSDSFLTNCGGLDGAGDFDGLWYFNNESSTYDNTLNRCYAQNGDYNTGGDDDDDSGDNTVQNNGAIAQALCCKTSISPIPSIAPTNIPSNIPTNKPTFRPSNDPTKIPSKMPVISPTNQPTGAPSKFPTNAPSKFPTNEPSNSPTITPTGAPSRFPTQTPSKIPSDIPSKIPSNIPSNIPSKNPSNMPSNIPSNIPTPDPSIRPSYMPTTKPSQYPSLIPSNMPSIAPSNIPTVTPSKIPSNIPSTIPSNNPTIIPTNRPSDIPSKIPSNQPSVMPTIRPSNTPTIIPSLMPTIEPTRIVVESPDSDESEDNNDNDSDSKDNIQTTLDSNDDNLTDLDNESSDNLFDKYRLVFIFFLAIFGVMFIVIIIWYIHDCRKKSKREQKFQRYQNRKLGKLDNINDFSHNNNNNNKMGNAISAENSMIDGPKNRKSLFCLMMRVSSYESGIRAPSSALTAASMSHSAYDDSDAKMIEMDDLYIKPSVINSMDHPPYQSNLVHGNSYDRLGSAYNSAYNSALASPVMSDEFKVAVALPEPPPRLHGANGPNDPNNIQYDTSDPRNAGINNGNNNKNNNNKNNNNKRKKGADPRKFGSMRSVGSIDELRDGPDEGERDLSMNLDPDANFDEDFEGLYNYNENNDINNETIRGPKTPNPDDDSIAKEANYNNNHVTDNGSGRYDRHSGKRGNTLEMNAVAIAQNVSKQMHEQQQSRNMMDLLQSTEGLDDDVKNEEMYENNNEQMMVSGADKDKNSNSNNNNRNSGRLSRLSGLFSGKKRISRGGFRISNGKQIITSESANAQVIKDDKYNDIVKKSNNNNSNQNNYNNNEYVDNEDDIPQGVSNGSSKGQRRGLRSSSTKQGGKTRTASKEAEVNVAVVGQRPTPNYSKHSPYDSTKW